MNNSKLAIVGLGYVGLPLAVEFAKKYETVGFDLSKERISQLKQGIDKTLEIEETELSSVLAKNSKVKSIGLTLSCNLSDISDCNVYIVAVPTPIDEHKNPDFSSLIGASRSVGKVLSSGDIVIYESTVYPGATEEVCVPILEKVSELKYISSNNSTSTIQHSILKTTGFFCGYSPERINPGDKKHRLPSIKKITSGSTPEAAKMVDELYGSIITAGTHLAPSIKIAEAAKVIENSQRDINIAFVNELAMIFNKLGIDTKSVLEAAGTKWNFLPFKPGLVGGHCIGVDPYYLAYKAKEVGYNPEIILAGRRLNDNMGIYVADRAIKLMIKKGHMIKNSKVLVLGITFKENCPDIRNSRVIDMINELKEFECDVDVYDPWADANDVKSIYNIDLIQHSKLNIQNYNAVILAVAHDKFKELGEKIKHSKLNIQNSLVVLDIKSFFDKDIVDGRV